MYSPLWQSVNDSLLILQAHSNLKHKVKGTTIEFIWAPFLTNTTKWLRDFAKSSDLESTHAAVVMSGAQTTCPCAPIMQLAG